MHSKTMASSAAIAVAAFMFALVGCVSVEGTKAQLASGDPAKQREARQIAINKVCDGRNLSMQERLQWLDILPDNNARYEAYEKMNGHDGMRATVIERIDLSAKTEAIGFIMRALPSSDAAFREKAKRVFGILDEKDMVTIIDNKAQNYYDSDSVAHDLSVHLATTAKSPDVIFRLLTEKRILLGVGDVNTENNLRNTLNNNLLPNAENISVDMAEKLLMDNGQHERQFLDFKYLTNKDLIIKLIEKLPKDKQKGPQNVLNTLRAKQSCIVDGIDWNGLFDIFDGEAVITENFPAYHKLKEDHFPAHLTIPSSLAGCPVTRIARNAFQHFKLKSVVMPSSVRDIGECAFGNYSFAGSEYYPCQKSLENVVIGTGVTNVAESAFGRCANLTNVTIYSGNKDLTFGKEAFKNCKKLRPIGGTWRFYPGSTFDGCDSYHDENGFRIIKGVLEKYYGDATSVVIPDGVTDICPLAFNGNKRLKAIVIPEGVKRIGAAAFGGCKALREVVVPQSVEVIEENAFWECILLNKFVLKNEDTAIKGNAFHDCKNLIWVETPTKKILPSTWQDSDALFDRELNRFRRNNPIIY